MAEKELEVYGKHMEPLKIVPYEHNAKYYETDQMGIVHHSNYIRWMEEARMDLMKADGSNGDYQSGAFRFLRVSQHGTF